MTPLTARVYVYVHMCVCVCDGSTCEKEIRDRPSWGIVPSRLPEIRHEIKFDGMWVVAPQYSRLLSPSPSPTPFPPCIHVHSTSHVLLEQQRRREIRSYTRPHTYITYTTTLGIVNALTITKHEHFSSSCSTCKVSLSQTHPTGGHRGRRFLDELEIRFFSQSKRWN